MCSPTWSPMPTAEEFIDAARTAAPLFDLEPESVTVLSQSENVVCEINARGGDRAVMRLHRPGYNDLRELESEVVWVAALRDAGLPVPSPRPTTDGGYYVETTIGAETRMVGAVEWIDGQPLSDAATTTGEGSTGPYHQIGRLAAQIRSHSVAWHPPSRFVRRRWDGDGLVGEAPSWGRFWELEALSNGQRSLFSRARSRLRDELATLAVDGSSFGLIHADLHPGNLMVSGSDLTVIDFDDAGFGWFMYELAVALHPVLGQPWEADVRAALIDGYRQVHTVSGGDERLIDVFLTIRCLMIVGWLDARRELPTHQHFEALVDEAVLMAERYLATN